MCEEAWGREHGASETDDNACSPPPAPWSISLVTIRTRHDNGSTNGIRLLTLNSQPSTINPMDDRDRDKFYSASDATADDDEYELEAPDETVISPEKRHAQEIARRN